MGKLDNGASGDEILERMTHYLICPSFLPHVSWTGRGKGKERKFALSSCVRLVNFIVITINKIDSSYNHKKVVSDMTYGILKRAPLKFGKIKACNQKDCPVPISKELDSEKKKADSADANQLACVSTKTVSLPSQSPSSSSCSSEYKSETSNQNYMSEHFQRFMPQSDHIPPIHQRPPPPLNYWDSRYSMYSYPQPIHRL